MSTRQPNERPGPTSPHRQRQVDEAIHQWTDQLMDVTGRNQLLFYRDLKVGTLDLADAEPVALDALLRGRKSSISRLFNAAAVPDRLKRARAIRAKALESLEERGVVDCLSPRELPNKALVASTVMHGGPQGRRGPRGRTDERVTADGFASWL